MTTRDSRRRLGDGDDAAVFEVTKYKPPDHLAVYIKMHGFVKLRLH